MQKSQSHVRNYCKSLDSIVNDKSDINEIAMLIEPAQKYTLYGVLAQQTV